LQGHVAINISSGNKTLDSQFADAIQDAFPNFASKADTVNNEDLYQMAIKVYRENSLVVVNLVVTNFQQNNIVERTVTVKKVSSEVMETLQYKTAIVAKNEFDVYLDSIFRNTGTIVTDARLIPPPPQKEKPQLEGAFIANIGFALNDEGSLNTGVVGIQIGGLFYGINTYALMLTFVDVSLVTTGNRAEVSSGELFLLNLWPLGWNFGNILTLLGGGGIGFGWNDARFAWKVSGAAVLTLEGLILDANYSYGDLGSQIYFGIGIKTNHRIYK
jgi:hypothetical protein